ncbi:MAG TPA: GNAT family N-acetyltransferase [Kofleriaceae bacterium]|nr:GNAT family N-acetyltransferase [Kofleriaceae bacterium]
MASAHVLDRPVWTALATRQAAWAVGGERARRFVPDVGPLAGARDDEPESLAALAALVADTGDLLLLQAEPIAIPPGVIAATTAAGVQLVAGELVDVEPEPRIELLTEADAPAMLALATLTRPGPFGPRTASLGTFWGVRDGGALVAMAGERLRQPGYTEVSGVCTHPDARGRGLARALSARVARRIRDRRETPYLHAYATNTAAIELYESLGFRLRCEVHVARLTRA